VDPELQVAFETLRQHVDRGFAQVSQRFDQVDQRFEAVDRRFDQVDQSFGDVGRRLSRVEQGVEALNAWKGGTDQRLDRLEAGLTDLGRHVEVTAAKTRRYFDLVAEDLRGDVRLVAEGFSRIDTLETTLRGEIARSHDALAGLFRLAYTDLDRRVRVLEGRPPDSA
jgi:hypothetical protein